MNGLILRMSVSDEEIDNTRIPHQGVTDRIFHTYHDWECHKAGFYAQNVDGKEGR